MRGVRLRPVTRARIAAVRAGRERSRRRPQAIRIVERILARYAAGCANVSPLDFVMRSIRQPLQSSVTTLSANVNVKLSLVSRLATIVRRRTTRMSQIVWSDAPAAAPDAGPPAVAAAATAPIVERVLARTTRVEWGAPVSDDARRGAAERHGAQPPPRPQPSHVLEFVMRRSVEVVREAAPAAPSKPALATVFQQSSPEATARPNFGAAIPIALSSAEIGRLTDDVVRAIDRRIVSYRERMGAV